MLSSDRKQPDTAGCACAVQTMDADVTPHLSDLWSTLGNCAVYMRMLLLQRLTDQPSHDSDCAMLGPTSVKNMPGERDNAWNTVRCTQARKTTHCLDGQHQYVDRTPPRKSQSEWQRTEINGESTYQPSDRGRLKNRTEPRRPHNADGLIISGVTGPNITKFVTVVFFMDGVNDGVNETIRFAIRPPVVERKGDI